MGILLQICVAILSVLTLLGMMAVVRLVARRYGLSAELQRKLVHVGTGLYALTLPWLFPERWPVYLLIGMTLVVMFALRSPQFAKGGIGETLHGVERQSYGDLLLALAVGTVFLLSDGRPILYVLPIAILTLSDAAAALTGSRYGRRFFQIEAGTKSLEGSVAFFMVTLILAMICLLLLSDIPRANVILVSVILAGFGTLVEADSWRGFDNFFLPAGLMVFLEAQMNAPPLHLTVIMLLFSAAIWSALRIAPKLNLTPHAARVYVIATFLLVTVTAWPNAVLPVLVFAAHAVLNRQNPCKAGFPALDIVAAMALVSFGWLASEKITGFNALTLYGLNALGMVVALLALLMVPPRATRQWLWLGAAILGIIALYLALMRYNGHGSLALAILTAAVVLGPTLQLPERFLHNRAAKLALLALAVPFAACFWIGVVG